MSKFFFAILVSALTAGEAAALASQNPEIGILVGLAVWFGLCAVVIAVSNVSRAVRGELEHK